MNRIIGSLSVAFSMYSILPAPRAAWEPENMRYTMCLFPLVGLPIGGAVWGWLWLADRLGLPAALTAAAAVAIPAALTGGIHLDGFCDTADALGSRAPRERKLEILKDPHIGAFALIACCIYLLLQFGCWSAYVYTTRTAALLALGYPLARTLSGLSVVCFPRAKTSGTVAILADAAVTRRSRVALCCGLAVCAAGMLWAHPLLGGGCLVGAAGLFGYYRWKAQTEFGGVTGDLAGWFLQLCEGLILVIVAVGGDLL